MVARLEQDPAGSRRGGRMKQSGGSQAVAGLVGIIAATLMLIVLTWVGTISAVRTQRAEAETRVAASVRNQAELFEEQLQRQLLEIDQTLRIIANAWEADPAHFDMLTSRNLFVLLNDISPTVFIVDDHGTIQGGTVPQVVGSDVSDRDFFRYEATRTSDDGRMFIGASALGKLLHDWHMNLARPLHHPDGSFAGVVAAGLRLNAISNFYQIADIGTNGVIALIE